MKKMLGFYSGLQPIEFLNSVELKNLLGEYLECLKIEEVPEKGERRVSDDYVFVIEEVFREDLTGQNVHVPEGVKLFRIGLLEF